MARMVIGGLFNAFSFAGAGFLFSHLDKQGYEEETNRHNLAMEKLDKEKEVWYEKEVERKNRIEEKRYELDDANADINVTNKALDNLAAVLEQQITKLELEETPEPTLSDFYEPSEKMKEYETLTVIVIGGVGGFAGYEAYKYFWTSKRK